MSQVAVRTMDLRHLETCRQRTPSCLRQLPYRHGELICAQLDRHSHLAESHPVD